MRIGIISDIHGNVQALDTVLADIENRGVDFDRDECGCAYRDPVERELGGQSFNWTKTHVTSENKAFLRTLLKELRIEADGKRVLLVHGSPRKINEYLFEDRPYRVFNKLLPRQTRT